MAEEEVEKEEKQMKQETLAEEEKDLIDIQDSKRNIIFICLVFIGTLSSLDGGIIPQQNSNIQKDFDPNAGEYRVGLFGSIDYIGRVFGAIIFTLIMGRMNRKMLLVSTLIFSMPGGEVADKYNKTQVIKTLVFTQIITALLICLGIYLKSSVSIII